MKTQHCHNISAILYLPASVTSHTHGTLLLSLPKYSISHWTIRIWSSVDQLLCTNSSVPTSISLFSNQAVNNTSAKTTPLTAYLNHSITIKLKPLTVEQQGSHYICCLMAEFLLLLLKSYIFPIVSIFKISYHHLTPHSLCHNGVASSGPDFQINPFPT